MHSAVITGATGAVGTALIKELTQQGAEVLVLCRRNSRRADRIPEHPLVHVEYCDLEELSRLQNAAGRQYDVFFHLAWSGTTGQARNDMHLQNRNVQYALDAVKAAAAFGCHTFVGVGSQAEYGRVEGMLTPKTPAFPENGYGIGKLCAGHMTRELARQLGLRHIWMRILSVYGPNDGDQSMVMSTLRKLRAGTVPEFTPAGQLWDYLYSGDAARALRLAAEHGEDDRVYVLGSGTARPLADYIRTIRDVAAPGAKLAIGALPYGPKQVMHLQADISDLTRDTGWMPETPFHRGIEKILEELDHA